MFLVATLIELDSEKQSGMIYTTAINEVYYPFISF